MHVIMIVLITVVDPEKVNILMDFYNKRVAYFEELLNT